MLTARITLPHFSISAAINLPKSAGIVGIGGYRLRQRDIDVCVEKAAAEAVVVPLPDRTLGHRLAGTARDKKAVAVTLDAQGVNALISGAFRQRSNAA